MSDLLITARRVAARIVLAATVASAGAAMAQTTQPSAVPGVGAPATRSPQAIMADLQAISGKLRDALPSPASLRDADQRAKAAPAAIPVVRQMLSLMDEMAAINPMAARQIGPAKNQFYVLLAALGDAETIATLQGKADAGNVGAKTTLLAGKYISSADAAARTALAGEIAGIIKAQPADIDAAMIGMMAGQIGGAPAADSLAINEAIAAGSTPMAQQVAAQVSSEKVQADLLDKPFAISGKLHTGEEFTTESLKGKVVLIDFWATWCGPCIQELPRVKKIYEQYKGQGFEIVGVSCDEKGEDLAKFLANDTAMSWPQMFDSATPGWHPLATKYGVTGIPQMFLIDKKGVLRSVEARESMEELIPKLLAE